MSQSVVWRASVLHFLEDPVKQQGSEDAWEFFEDGALLVEDGLITRCGPSDQVFKNLPAGTEIKDLIGRLLVPGFIDTHVHYPQLEVLAGCGVQLLDWLNQYTFPAEQKFADEQYASEIAQFFLDQCLSHGTTTALVFGTVAPQSVDAFFQQAHQRNLRMIAGKVMMDRNAPDYLLDTPQSSYEDSKALINRWHNKGRLAYAVTPVLPLPHHRNSCTWLAGYCGNTMVFICTPTSRKTRKRLTGFRNCSRTANTMWMCTISMACWAPGPCLPTQSTCVTTVGSEWAVPARPLPFARAPTCFSVAGCLI